MSRLQLTDPTQAITYHRPQDVLYIGSHPTNQLVIPDAAVAPFQAMLDFRQRPYRLLRLTADGHLTVGGVSPPPDKAVLLKDSDVIQLGEYRLTFAPESARTQPLASPGVSVPPQTVTVGQTATYHVNLSNDTAKLVTFVIKVEGVPESWMKLDSFQVQLQAGAQTSLKVNITPPRHPSSHAGDYQLTITTTASHYAPQIQKAALTVRPYHDFKLTAADSLPRKLSWVRQTAQTTVSLTNQSNVPLSIQLSGVDDYQALRFEFPGTPDIIALQPGETQHIPVQIKAEQRQWLGWSNTVYPFRLTATSTNGPHLLQTIAGEIKGRIIIGAPIISALATGGVAMAIFTTLHFGGWASYDYRGYTSVPLMLSTPPTFSSGDGDVVFSNVEPPVPGATLAAMPITDMTYAMLFQAAAQEHNLDWRLLAAVGYHESGFNPTAVGRDNDMGVMQIIPDTWQQWAPVVGVSDPYDPYSNIQVGAAFLADVRDYCLSRGRTDTYWMLIAYNWGPENVGDIFDRNGGWDDVPTTQRQYAINIMNTAGAFSPQWQEQLAKRPYQ